jgi:hypothetical protein
MYRAGNYFFMYFDKYLLYRNMFKIKVVHVNETYISFV